MPRDADSPRHDVNVRVSGTNPPESTASLRSRECVLESRLLLAGEIPANSIQRLESKEITHNAQNAMARIKLEFVVPQVHSDQEH